MGIRQNLAMGYGLYPLNFMTKEEMENALTFDRLEDRSLFNAVVEDLQDSLTSDDDSTFERMAFHPKVDPAKDLYEIVRYDPEFGLDDFVLLIPSGQQKSWYRYADLMDIYLIESIDPDDNMTPKVYPINSTLYPYVTLMKPDPETPRGYSFYWNPCWRDKEEFKNAIPGVPDHLWFVLKHVFGMSDKNTTELFLSLRPCLYKSYG